MGPPNNTYDVIVIGAGIEGSATAYDLAKNKQNTLLLEQFSLPHSRGSSHGQSRIIRKAYSQEHFAKMMPESYKIWSQLEKESNKQLYKKIGMLYYGRISEANEAKNLEDYERALKAVNTEYEKLDASQMQNRFPAFQVESSTIGLLDKDAGILRADSALGAFQDVFKRYGGTIVDGVKVTGIIPGDIVHVNTNTGVQFKAAKVVITAGPWTSKLVEPLGLRLPLNPIRVTVCYWKQKRDVCSVKSGCPAFICGKTILSVNGKDCHFYGIPVNEYENLMKVCQHGGIDIDPDYRDVTTETWDVSAMQTFVRENIPALEESPSIIERCIYTMTPDENFVLDYHPQWKNIVIGAGFSGHGFKLSPVVGKILSQLARGKKPSYDMSWFSVKHHQKKLQAKL